MDQNETVEETVNEQELTEGEVQGEITDETAAATAGETAPKRAKKLSKAIEGTVVKITVIDGEKGEMTFDVSTLPEEIQAALVPFGAGHKLGDAAAGRTGKEAEEAIEKVWEGLVKGDWSVRAPAAQKVSLTDIASNLANMSPEEQAQARALLAGMGIKL